jgi:uncharacterized membrane protein
MERRHPWQGGPSRARFGAFVHATKARGRRLSYDARRPARGPAHRLAVAGVPHKKRNSIPHAETMQAIEQHAEIRTSPDDVFDLIARIEEFPLYSDFLKEVRAIGPDRYHWVARAGGIALEWDAIVTERDRPRRIAWRSVEGFVNSGRYELSPTPTGTAVSISIEYEFPSRLVEKLLSRLVRPLVRDAAAQILARVKQRLEHRKDAEPGDGRRPA